MLRNLILGLMLTGFVAILCCALPLLLWRKEGVSARELWMAGSKAAAYPERYVRPNRVLVVRLLSFMGVGLWLAGILIMVVGTVQPLLR